jgi:hypothetical protein
MKIFKNISENQVALFMTFFLIGLLFLLKYQDSLEINIVIPYTEHLVVTFTE